MSINKEESERGKRIGTPVPVLAPGIGTRIKAAADTLGSRKKAAEAAGVSDDMLYRYIREQSSPSFEAMVGLVSAAGVSLDWLATGIEPSSSVDQENQSPVTYQATPSMVHVEPRELQWLAWYRMIPDDEKPMVEAVVQRFAQNATKGQDQENDVG